MTRTQDLHDLCAQAYEDDGAWEARRYPHRRRTGKRGKPPRKRAQLCAQIRRALSLVLPATFDDPVLRDAQLLDVRPASDAMHLEVVLVLPEGADEAHARAALDAQRGWLRAEVASLIHRRKVPHLRYTLITA